MLSLTASGRENSSPAPLDFEDFARLMAAFPQPVPRRLALAVSGGPDSMALAFLMRRWGAAQEKPPELTAFIVDHALRTESAQEAVVTQERLAALGIRAEIVRWDHPPIASRLQESARAARYRLLADACRRDGIAHLLLAHQAQDQAETILMRLAKGSGVDGLAGMRARGDVDGVALWRPLLSVPKERLIAVCAAAGLSYVTDPGNTTDRFARGRLRQVMPLLDAEGLTLERLLDLGARAADAREALDHATGALARSGSTLDSAGAIHLALDSLRAAPRAVAQRLVGSALRAIHPGDYGAEHAALAALTDALTAAAPMPARTLHGCLIAKQDSHAVLSREISAIADALLLAAGATVIWDGRWELAGEGKTLSVKPLGNPPHATLDRLAPGLRKRIPQGRLRAALPALWDGDILARIPEAKLITKWPP